MSVYTLPVNTLQFDNFKYAKYVRNLTEEEFLDAKDTVLAMWSGVFELWECLDTATKDRKRSAVLNLLIMWYLADMYPSRLSMGQQGAGGMPISSKHIRDISITYSSLNLPDVYSSLATNQFGVKAAEMIHYAPEMMGVYL